MPNSYYFHIENGGHTIELVDRGADGAPQYLK